MEQAPESDPIIQSDTEQIFNEVRQNTQRAADRMVSRHQQKHTVETFAVGDFVSLKVPPKIRPRNSTRQIICKVMQVTNHKPSRYRLLSPVGILNFLYSAGKDLGRVERSVASDISFPRDFSLSGLTPIPLRTAVRLLEEQRNQLTNTLTAESTASQSSATAPQAPTTAYQASRGRRGRLRGATSSRTAPQAPTTASQASRGRRGRPRGVTSSRAAPQAPTIALQASRGRRGPLQGVRSSRTEVRAQTMASQAPMTRLRASMTAPQAPRGREAGSFRGVSRGRRRAKQR